MTAVIWTDVVQMFLYVAGAIVSFFVILAQIPGGWAHVWTWPAPPGKFQVFDFRFALAPRVLLADLHVLGRRHRRLLSHHGQPRHRAVDGAAAARRREPRERAGRRCSPVGS